MRILKNVETKKEVLYLEQVNDDIFIMGMLDGHIELRNKIHLTCLSRLKFKEI